jgi:hypothetical protein
MRKGIRSAIVTSGSIIVLLALSWNLPATAAVVEVGYYSLSPSVVNIQVGEIVYWVEDDDDLGPYLISGPWQNFYTPGGIQFNSPGTFHYTAASILGGGSWGGTVIVSPGVPNSPPVVTITSPTNNSVFTAPATFAFEADASDPDPGDLWDVEFWIDDEMVDDVYEPPYSTTVTNLPAGTYILRAIAWDYSYATATNSVTITVVNPGPITLNVASLTTGNFVLNASGLVVGKTTVLQSSTNLSSALNWISVSTNVAQGSTALFTNAISPGQRFFRILQSP